MKTGMVKLIELSQYNTKIPAANYISIKIYNMLGQEVKALINMKVKAGHHKVE